jgi:hypothetical protein
MKIFIALLFLMPFIVNAQDFFNFLSSETPFTSIELDGAFHPASSLEDTSAKTQIINSGVNVIQRVYKDDKQFISIGAKYQKLDLTADTPLLHDYYNQQGVLSYKRNFDSDKFWLGSVSYGSTSDEPFKSSDDNTLSVNYIQKVNSKWFIAGNYSNNRAFLNNVPLPGFFYIKEMTPEKILVLGFPVIYWMRPLSESFTLSYLGLLPWTHLLKILYTKWGLFKPYIGLEQSPQTYFRRERDEQFDRFFWFERRIGLGVEGRISQHLKFDVTNGLAFDRQFFEARNFTQEKNFLINVENSYFVGLKLRYFY